MALTLTNTNTISLLNILNRTSSEQSASLTRMSTGFRINSGKDDPAGLIALRSLDSELTAVDASLVNNQRTNAMLNVADSSLNEVSSLVNEIKSLAVASANADGLSADELAANQSQIDNAIAAIDRIIGSTEFNGKKLLDGTLAIDSTGVDSTKISDLKIFNRNSESSTDLTVSVTGAASQASLAFMTTSASSLTSVSITGKDGTATIEITSGENLSSVAAKINAATAQTGITASAAGANLTLLSSDYGDDAFVRTTVISGDTTNVTAGNDVGVDAKVTVNGQAAAVDGKDVNFSSNGVNVSFSLTTGYNNGSVTGDETFTISKSGGATFQLGTDKNTRETIGLDGLYSQQLGNSATGFLTQLRSGGAADLLKDPTKAAQIADLATKQIAKVQGRIGGFQKFQVETAINQQNTAKESLTAAISTIRDTDFAVESANLNRQNVLLQSSLSLLGLANQQSSQVLSLLR